MTVNTISSIAEFDTNGVTTNFPFYFKFLANEDLVVTYVDPLGVSSTLTLGTHYTVNGAGNDQGGSIVTTSALAGPGQLVVSREMEAFQQTSLRNQGKFLAEVHENVFDKLTMLIQQGLATFTRALKRPLGRDYFFAENRRITSVKDPEEPQDAATKNSVEQYVGSVLSAIQGPINNSANVLYVRPSGTPGVVQDLATGEGYDYVGATLPTGVFSTVKGFFNWILDRITLSTSGSASIVAAVAKGGKVVIKNGGHYLHAPAICDYGVDPVVGFPGHASKRYDIEGESPGGSIISNQHSDFAFKFSGSSPMTQNFGGFDRIGNLTIVGPNVTSPNTDNSGGAGIVISNKTRTEVYNLNFQNLSLGMELNDVVTSTMRNVNIGGCYAGIRGGPTLGITGPNAMHWTNTRVANTWGNAIDMAVGACLTFDGLTLEGNGTSGFSHTGLLLTAKAGDIASVININSLYTELNAGVADIYINNTSIYPVVLNVDGAMFARVDPARYVLSHIQANSSGGGRITVNLGSVSRFLVGFGYVPTAGRPFWSVGPNCEVIWNEHCSFAETTSLVYWLCLNRSYDFAIAADGTILAGPDGFACTSLGSGHYRLYRTTGLAEFAKFADDVAVKVTPGAGGFTAYIPTKTASAIDIQLHNGGAAGNAKFDISIKRVKGHYA
ncbi:hypothetical protein HBO37_12725 [Pseudomonas proteolytica]|uniref:hypothetical protein n=1 Tax=Pseudomonas proteolytica TaxID=219574 RepID=UPI001473F26C|nr:hypothetical protein [Pseudomonas proteolytica]NMZ06218.1 hypothetical protein [Pseudomonas proteolytica]